MYSCSSLELLIVLIEPINSMAVCHILLKIEQILQYADSICWACNRMANGTRIGVDLVVVAALPRQITHSSQLTRSGHVQTR